MIAGLAVAETAGTEFEFMVIFIETLVALEHIEYASAKYVVVTEGFTVNPRPVPELPSKLPPLEESHHLIIPFAEVAVKIAVAP